ncbi:hypothetical protein RhiirB3_394769 [Rhizophagus irregularis]|nr:hypothetical protein RhiirB3_394769 [Rhizophagus irregularis]
MNDNKFLPKLSQNLLDILNDEEYYDVTIEVGDRVRDNKKQANKCDTPIQEYEAEADHDSEKQPSKSDLNVISISDDELEPAFDDTPNDLSISGPFKLDYSTIADNSKKICEDDREIETESATAS